MRIARAVNVLVVTGLAIAWPPIAAQEDDDLPGQKGLSPAETEALNPATAVYSVEPEGFDE